MQQLGCELLVFLWSIILVLLGKVGKFAHVTTALGMIRQPCEQLWSQFWASLLYIGSHAHLRRGAEVCLINMILCFCDTMLDGQMHMSSMWWTCLAQEQQGSVTRVIKWCKCRYIPTVWSLCLLHCAEHSVTLADLWCPVTAWEKGATLGTYHIHSANRAIDTILEEPTLVIFIRLYW